MRSKKFYFVSSICLVAGLSGCILPEVVENAMATHNAKLRMLNESVANLHKSVRWQDLPGAVAVVKPEFASTFREKLIGNPRGLKIFDLKVERVEILPEDSETAHVDTIIRAYRVPAYVVQAERKREVWEFFHLKGTWLLKDVEPLGAVEDSDVGTM